MTEQNPNCGNCNKFIPSKIRKINCTTCKQFFHVKCCNINHKSFENMNNLGEDWNCQNCIKILNSTSTIPKTKCGKCTFEKIKSLLVV